MLPSHFIPSSISLCSLRASAQDLVICSSLSWPPYSEGKISEGVRKSFQFMTSAVKTSPVPILVFSFSMLLITLNLRLILSLRSVLQNSNTAHMGKGRLTRLMSLCRMGRFLSQMERTLEHSAGVQMLRWARVRPVQSNT